MGDYILRGFGLGSIIVLWAVLVMPAILKQRDQEPVVERPFSLRIDRTAGAEAQRSRCSDCTQPGDRIQVFPERSTDGTAWILIFYNDQIVMNSGRNVSALTFVVGSMGTHQIVGLDLAHVGECVPDVPARGMDAFVASMIDCGARFAMATVEVR